MRTTIRTPYYLNINSTIRLFCYLNRCLLVTDVPVTLLLQANTIILYVTRFSKSRLKNLRIICIIVK